MLRLPIPIYGFWWTMVDASAPWTDEDSRLFEKLSPLGSLLVALNKSDLPPQITDLPPGFSPPSAATLHHDTTLASNSSGAALKGGATPREGAAVVQTSTPDPETVRTSALTGDGIYELKEKILTLAAPARDIGPEGEFITNLRHQQLLKNSLTGLAKAHHAAEQQTPHEMLLLDLYDALRPSTSSPAPPTPTTSSISFSRRFAWESSGMERRTQGPVTGYRRQLVNVWFPTS